MMVAYRCISPFVRHAEALPPTSSEVGQAATIIDALMTPYRVQSLPPETGTYFEQLRELCICISIAEKQHRRHVKTMRNLTRAI
ncbi:hypothetical protein BDW66DRAFT_51660 [Aspergillus desertorum]